MSTRVRSTWAWATIGAASSSRSDQRVAGAGGGVVAEEEIHFAVVLE
jgi:hypothetical protein